MLRSYSLFYIFFLLCIIGCSSWQIGAKSSEHGIEVEGKMTIPLPPLPPIEVIAKRVEDGVNKYYNDKKIPAVANFDVFRTSPQEANVDVSLSPRAYSLELEPKPILMAELLFPSGGYIINLSSPTHSSHVAFINAIAQFFELIEKLHPKEYNLMTFKGIFEGSADGATLKSTTYYKGEFGVFKKLINVDGNDLVINLQPYAPISNNANLAALRAYSMYVAFIDCAKNMDVKNISEKLKDVSFKGKTFTSRGEKHRYGRLTLSIKKNVIETQQKS